ncbi:M14 family metallopeptidase [Allomuricauda sp. d1]|uniref:M14 family metallopeptidase n=1 Tax=Allomuricauda sp. d1 TaxID=3136725 RepID=UPI0031D62CB4
MKKIAASVAIILCFACKTETVDKKSSYPTIFEESGGKQTATYTETIDFYLALAREFPEINIQSIGQTDIGLPLHMVTFNAEGSFNFQKIRQGKTIILINNGIHPGESDGIDATMLLYRDLATGNLKSPENVVLVTIPVYNIGGALNRNSTSRANQNGPESYGFRGNAQNYDLNRDFIKADTKNAASFAQIFHLVKPDIFIDNHVSNGADYQYTLTHLFTQHNKLGGDLGEYIDLNLKPALEQSLSEKDWPVTPYVNVFNRPPETGFSQFMDWPRYSTGYTTLWNTLGMMVETHMLKPYKERVEGTYELMASMVQIADAGHENIKKLRKESNQKLSELNQYHLNWQLDSTRTSTLQFLGYEADTVLSEVTGLNRLTYDRKKPITKEVTYYNHYVPADTIKVPAAYLIKKGWHEVIKRLEQNEIDFYRLEADTTLQVESYRIKNYQTTNTAYEGHYPHYGTSVDATVKEVTFHEGDFVVPAEQAGLRYLLETLEPAAVDSFFNWNFFDSILQQKEGFSPYIFEDVALKLLKENKNLRDSFLLRKQTDEPFSKSWYAQLDWVYKNSENYEKAHLQYPVYRILKDTEAAGIVAKD